MKPQLKKKIEHQHQGKYQHLVGHHIILSNNRRGSDRSWGMFGPWKVECECKIIAVHDQNAGIQIAAVILEVDKKFPKDAPKYQQKQRDYPPDLEIGDVVCPYLRQCRVLNPEAV